MKIEKNNILGNIGYSKGFQMLTNFVFEIISVEYRDNLYGYFTIKLYNEKTHLVLSDISICGPNGGDFLKRISGIYWMINPNITNDQILEIFSYEFDQYKTALQIKELQAEQLAHGNQRAALETSEGISFEDKKTLRAHYSTKQTELQERIDKLTLELSVVGSETIIAQTHYSD